MCFTLFILRRFEPVACGRFGKVLEQAVEDTQPSRSRIWS